MRRESLVPPELDERLIEWARYFKDRHKFNRCASLEGRFSPYAPDAWDSGWGEPGAPVAPLPEILLPRVLRTHEAVQSLERAYKWVVTYGYCFPSLERWQVLKSLRKYTGRRYTWGAYLDALEIAKVRVWAGIR